MKRVVTGALETRALEENSAQRALGKPAVIGILQGSANTSISGGDRYCLEIWRAWTSDAGMQVRVMTSLVGSRAFSAYGYGLDVSLATESDDTALPLVLRYLLRAGRCCIAALATRRADVVFAASAYFYDVIPALVIQRRSRGLLVVPVFHLIPPPWKRSGRWVSNLLAWLENIVMLRIIRAAADLVVVDNALLQNDLRSMGFQTQAMYLTKMGVKPIMSKPKEEQKGADAIFVGRLTMQKGIDELLRVWRLVCDRRRESLLLIVGYRSLEYDVDSAVDKLDLRRNVRIISGASDSEVQSSLLSSTLFVSASREEGYGLSILEALAAGLPCVTYDLPVFRQVFPYGRAWPAVANEVQMADRILSVLDSQAEQERLRREIATGYAFDDWTIVSRNLHRAIGVRKREKGRAIGQSL